MNVLVACECSGVIREAFRSRGHNAWSCDLQPAADGSQFHINGDALWVAENNQWDLMIAHPPCTYLSNSSVHLLTEPPGKFRRKPGTLIGEQRMVAMKSSTRLFRSLLEIKTIKHVCIENPIVHGYARAIVGRHTQLIQPYNFGEDASKATCLWLRNLPPLRSTKRFYGRMVNGRERFSNQTDGGWNRLAPSDDRAQIRATTYPGIAEAMAEQWGNL